MKKANQIVQQYHSLSDDIQYKKQLLRLSNELSRLIETTAGKNFREMGYTVQVQYLGDLHTELTANGYKVLFSGKSALNEILGAYAEQKQLKAYKAGEKAINITIQW
jgi:hypothetical protein